MGTTAEEKLTAVIDAAVSDYYAEAEIPGLPAGWVLLINDIGVDTDCDTSGVTIAYPHGTMPWTSALGIVEAARIRMHTSFGQD
jgi:hypothetical protein